MKAGIDIDIGGTFTDCFINWEGKLFFNKTPTTGYNLSVGFMKAIRDGASLIGVPKIVIFPFSSIFCAFGSSTMDMVHICEQSKHIPLLRPMTKEPFTDYDEFNEVVRGLQERALKEFRMEGFPAEAVSFVLELDMKFGGVLNLLRITSPRMFLQSEEDVMAVYRQFERDYSEVYSPFSVYPEGGVDIGNFALKAILPRPKIELPTYEFNGETPRSETAKGKRPAYWEEYGGFKETPIYDGGLLECGNRVEGPAIIEAEDTTTVLPPGTRYTVNKYLFGEIEKI